MLPITSANAPSCQPQSHDTGLLQAETERASIHVSAAASTSDEDPPSREGVPHRPRSPARLLCVHLPEHAFVRNVDTALNSLAEAHHLSERETVILRYIALGYRYREIGVELGISPRTVKMHAANVRRKVGVRSRFELLRKMFHS